MSDFIPNHLGFNYAAYMKEFFSCVDIALNRLSRGIQDIMRREIMANGNGSAIMRRTACEQVKEISRSINEKEVELVVGIDEDKLGGFTDQTFVRTMVVLHGNVTSGPLMTKPGQMTWNKHVTNMSMSPLLNKDGTPRKPKMLPDEWMQFEKVNGFGRMRHMLDNMFDKEANRVIRDFYSSLDDLLNSIDYSEYITVG